MAAIEAANGSKPTASATNSPREDGTELNDIDARPPLPVEQDLMQLARLGELRPIQKLFDSGKYTAKSADDQGITALHVCLGWTGEAGKMELMYG